MGLIVCSVIGVVFCYLHFVLKMKGTNNNIKPKNNSRGYVDTNICDNCKLIGTKLQLKINQPCVRCGWFVCENDPSKWVVNDGEGKWVSMYSSEDGSNMSEKISRLVSDYVKHLETMGVDCFSGVVNKYRFNHTFPKGHDIFKNKNNEWVHKINDESYGDLIKRIDGVIGHTEPYHEILLLIIYKISKKYKK